MSKSSWQKPFFGPTAIAVHDDADVLWKRVRSQLNSLIKRQIDSTTSCHVKKAAISGLLGFSVKTSSN
jgi:serine acetyltransferase